MWHNFELNGEFFLLLLGIDRQTAEAMRIAGCHCGGRLHRANFPRKPRGIPRQMELAYGFRFSFCCDRDGCRKRHTPISVRFLGQRVYVAAVVVVACVWAQQQAADAPEAECQPIATNPPVYLAPKRTVKRWLKWWQTGFVASALYATCRGRFVPPVCTEQLPLSLFSRFLGTATDKLKATLKFVSPLSVGTYRSGLLMVE
jgi:hypothetical protein